MTAPTYKKKLIEVALPLEAINAASAHEKSVPRRGHPATLHLWWARRPLAACRAVLFASLVDDPSEHPDRFPTEDDQAEERGRLFKLIEQLVKWENTTNEDVLNQARQEILKSTDGNPPPVLDPFCGGGSIPLEAQRLGLEAHGSDLNPVAVLITKALIEIPPKFANQPPVNPKDRDSGYGARWKGAAGLAADVRYYGQWMRDEAEKRTGHLYPKVTPPPSPQNPNPSPATVIAWLWARTVTCPNPACGAQMPLVTSFKLSTKKGKEAWIEPIVDRVNKSVRFEVRTGPGEPPEPPKTGRGAKFRCLVCEQVSEDSHIKQEGFAKRHGQQLMAIVAEGHRGRTYLSPTEEHERIALDVEPAERPVGRLADDPRNIWCVGYGLTDFADLFTDRQLVALTTFSDLVGEARERVEQDAIAAGLTDDGVALNDGGTGARAYADAVATYLAFTVSKLSDWSSSICSWIHSIQGVRNTFARQAIPMVWDFVEVNPLSDSVGNWMNHVDWVCKFSDGSPMNPADGRAVQAEASRQVDRHERSLFSTDPPYYDNISYADLSDFFYIWLRRSLGQVHPALFGTLQTPKTDELIASPYRHGGNKQDATRFFETGLNTAFNSMRSSQHSEYPMTVYYAFKQSEMQRVDGDGVGPGVISSTGWETMLQGLLDAGFSINGTWPMRTERAARTIGIGSNALASSIVLVCRPRPTDAPIATRSDFNRALRRELPQALQRLQYGNVAPVDLAQAAIGPGMTIFSRYSKVMESSGEPMRVRTALQLINQELDTVLTTQEGELDADTRWAITWFEQYGTRDGAYGDAETLSKAKDTSISGLVEAGILEAKGGKVRLLSRDELRADWDPATERRITIWEVTQYLIRSLYQDGEPATADLVRRVGGYADLARTLAYRLYTVCERKKWADEALAYNSLVIAWPELQRLAGAERSEEQSRLM